MLRFENPWFSTLPSVSALLLGKAIAFPIPLNLDLAYQTKSAYEIVSAFVLLRRIVEGGCELQIESLVSAAALRDMSKLPRA